MTREETIIRGQAAARILDDGTFKAALKAVEDECSEAWKSTKPEDSANRERIYLLVQAMADIGRMLTKWKGEATVELHKIDQARREQAA